MPTVGVKTPLAMVNSCRWRIFNLTADTHPIHFHIVNVQVLSRQPFKVVNGVFTPTGVARGPEPNELGWKETVQMHPGEVIEVAMKFDLPPTPNTVPFSTRPMGLNATVIPNANEYVWHCHILEHEEHDMMRPLVVTGVNPKLLSVFPYAAGINGYTGGSAAFSIFGDNPITSVTSNNAAYPATWTPGATSFTVNIAPLSAPAVVTYTVTDSLGKTATATVDIFGVTPAYAASIPGLTGGVASFGISGGKRPYTIVGSNPAYPAVAVTDAAGNVIGFTVNVAANPLFVGPITVTYTVADSSAPALSAVVTLSLV